jgi:hypothetical protein
MKKTQTGWLKESSCSMLWLLLLLLPWGQQVQAQWQECSSQGAFIGMYGSQALANLTTFRSNLLSHVWQSYNPDGAHSSSSSSSSLGTHATRLSHTGHTHDICSRCLSTAFACSLLIPKLTLPRITHPARVLQLLCLCTCAALFLQGAKQFELFQAIISCPPHRQLKQYSSSSSFCDLSKLQKPCIIYSIGPAGSKEFEKAALENTECQVHSVQCGGTDGSESHERRHKQHAACFVGAAASNGSSSSSAAEAADSGAVTLGLLAHKLGHLRGIDAAHVGLQGEQLLQFLSQLKQGPYLPRQLSLALQLPAEKASSGLLKAPAELALVFQHMAALGYAATSSKVTDAAANSTAGECALHSCC